MIIRGPGPKYVEHVSTPIVSISSTVPAEVPVKRQPVARRRRGAPLRESLVHGNRHGGRLFVSARPSRVLRECRRVLDNGGRLAVITSGPELRGTSIVPEPLASLAHFYDEEALATLAHDAGFGKIAVVDNSGEKLLTGRKKSS